MDKIFTRISYASRIDKGIYKILILYIYKNFVSHGGIVTPNFMLNIGYMIKPLKNLLNKAGEF